MPNRLSIVSLILRAAVCKDYRNNNNSIHQVVFTLLYLVIWTEFFAGRDSQIDDLVTHFFAHVRMLDKKICMKLGSTKGIIRKAYYYFYQP